MTPMPVSVCDSMALARPPDTVAMPICRQKYVARAAPASIPHLSVNLVPRPAKHCIAAIVAANLSIISNVFEDAMTTFHSLTVAKVEPETRDAVTITFAVPQPLQEAYRFRPGQHLTLKASFDGEELRRCYSILPQLSARRN